MDDALTDWDITLDECELEQQVPVVTDIISKNENGFVYEGYFIDPEFVITLYYFKYSITFDGKITKHNQDVVAKCGQGVMF